MPASTGCVKGRQAIFENFRAKPFIFAMHVFVNPAIDVDLSGDTASGRWVHHLFITQDDTRTPVHGLGYTQDLYRRVDGHWLFSRCRNPLQVPCAVHSTLVAGRLTVPIARLTQVAAGGCQWPD